MVTEDRQLFLAEADVMKALERAKVRLIEKYDQLDLRASGKWAETLETRLVGIKGQILGEFYSEYMVKGRKPGAAPPVRAIYQWMLDKKTFRGEKSLGRAIAISKSIGAQGTVAYREGGTDLLEILDDPEMIAEFTAELQTAMEIRIAEELRRIIRESFEDSIKDISL